MHANPVIRAAELSVSLFPPQSTSESCRSSLDAGTCWKQLLVFGGQTRHSVRDFGRSHRGGHAHPGIGLVLSCLLPCLVLSCLVKWLETHWIRMLDLVSFWFLKQGFCCGVDRREEREGGRVCASSIHRVLLPVVLASISAPTCQF